MQKRKNAIYVSLMPYIFLLLLLSSLYHCILPKSDRIFVLDKVRLVYFIIYLQKVLVNYTYRHLHSN